MFVRRINHKNGKTYVQVVEKNSGRYRVLKNIGSARGESEVSRLLALGQQWVSDYLGFQEFDFTLDRNQLENAFHFVDQLKLVGLELLLGKIFDQIGFNQVQDELFRHLVLYRLAFPKSKLKTTEYLYRYQQMDWSEDQVYRYLDKLHSTQRELVQSISYEHTLKVMGGEISAVFYDVTTLYFEIDNEDELRKTGFSKEGRHQNPQVVLGLLVSRNGYPLAYDLFEGNKFEGHTMLPIIEYFRSKYHLGKLIVIADAGLLSTANIDELQTRNYEFILGARIKNESNSIRQKILQLNLKDGDCVALMKGGLRLIVTFSSDRARKDKHNREKGLRKLEKQLRTGRLTKASINNRGYNKYLKLEGEMKVSIDMEKYEKDAKWDGLKGYLTNAKLPKDQIVENYLHLWQIENAFRITKSDLRIRPVFHRIPRRIEAHICISFVAYKIFKELERILKEKHSELSPVKAIEIAENIYQLQATLPSTGEKVHKILLLTVEQKKLAKLFDFGC